MGVSAVQCRYSCSNYIFNAYHSSQKSGRHPIRTELFRLHPMRGPRSLFPCVGSVCVTPNYNVTCIRVLTHVISGPGPALWSLYPPYFSFCVARGTYVVEEVSYQAIRRQYFRYPPMTGRGGWLVRCQSYPPHSFVDLSAASRPHPSPATRNKTETWLIDDTTRKGGIHLEQDDFHREQRGNIWKMNAEDVLGFMIGVGSWHIDMTPRDAQDQLRGIRGVRREGWR